MRIHAQYVLCVYMYTIQIYNFTTRACTQHVHVYAKVGARAQIPRKTFERHRASVQHYILYMMCIHIRIWYAVAASRVVLRSRERITIFPHVILVHRFMSVYYYYDIILI
jgi:hypothetical protein